MGALPVWRCSPQYNARWKGLPSGVHLSRAEVVGLIRSEVNGSTCLIEEQGWGNGDVEGGVHLFEKVFGTRFSPYYVWPVGMQTKIYVADSSWGTHWKEEAGLVENAHKAKSLIHWQTSRQPHIYIRAFTSKCIGLSARYECCCLVRRFTPSILRCYSTLGYSSIINLWKQRLLTSRPIYLLLGEPEDIKQSLQVFS